MSTSKTAFLSLGSNLGDRQLELERAMELLNGPAIVIVRRSSIYETAPREVLQQPWFLNMVMEVETTLFPLQLLNRLQTVERSLGRDRTSGQRFGPRSIDIDILLYGNSVITLPQLTVPHPRMRERRFVLEPLAEIAPELRDPSSGRRFREYLTEVQDQATRIATML